MREEERILEKYNYKGKNIDTVTIEDIVSDPAPIAELLGRFSSETNYYDRPYYHGPVKILQGLSDMEGKSEEYVSGYLEIKVGNDTYAFPFYANTEYFGVDLLNRIKIAAALGLVAEAEVSFENTNWINKRLLEDDISLFGREIGGEKHNLFTARFFDFHEQIPPKSRLLLKYP